MSALKSLVRPLFLLLLLPVLLSAEVSDFYDCTHYSPAFKEWRHYRIILPRDYQTSGKYYPVIYYFHGHSGRYTGEQYGNGQVFLPEMIEFVRSHDVIVVRWDGYVEQDYNGFYGGAPYDIQGFDHGLDFGAYFLDLIAHIDSTYRTLDDRQHRATCGLSMGGFMSLYISARFPHLVGSASAFNPAHEFFTGPHGMQVLYAHWDHVLNHGHSRVRLVKASGDYIGQYHDMLREVYARTPEVDFEFRQDEYHRHWVTSVAETFGFHMKAFEDVGLTAYPKVWSYDNAYSGFSVWGYEVKVANKKPGYVSLRNVSWGYFRLLTREYFPDGPPVSGQTIRLTTPSYYGNAESYRILDYCHADGKTRFYTLKSSPKGQLTFELDGLGHDVSILTGKESRTPVLLPPDSRGAPVVETDADAHLQVRLLNASGETLRDVRASLTSEYPTVTISGRSVAVDSLAPGEVADLSDRFTLRFVSTSGSFQHCRVNLEPGSERIDVDVLPTPLEQPAGLEIMDGRTRSFTIFRQAGNRGGGAMLQREYTEGTGNGNGKAEPGEELTLWVMTPQGLDPLDKNSWHRAKIYTDDPYVTVTRDFAEVKELEWTSVRDHTCAFRISPDCPAGHQIRLFLKNESYSFVWTPDVRYGRELLYQARQRHMEHICQYLLTVGGQ